MYKFFLECSGPLNNVRTIPEWLNNNNNNNNLKKKCKQFTILYQNK